MKAMTDRLAYLLTILTIVAATTTARYCATHGTATSTPTPTPMPVQRPMTPMALIDVPSNYRSGDVIDRRAERQGQSPYIRTTREEVSTEVSTSTRTHARTSTPSTPHTRARTTACSTWNTVLTQPHLARRSCGVVNINTASLDELAHLPGVGPTLALAIYDYAESTDGGFKAPTDLLQVKGIGRKRFETMKLFVTVDKAQKTTATAKIRISKQEQ